MAGVQEHLHDGHAGNVHRDQQGRFPLVVHLVHGGLAGIAREQSLHRLALPVAHRLVQPGVAGIILSPGRVALVRGFDEVAQACRAGVIHGGAAHVVLDVLVGALGDQEQGQFGPSVLHGDEQGRGAGLGGGVHVRILVEQQFHDVLAAGTGGVVDGGVAVVVRQGNVRAVLQEQLHDVPSALGAGVRERRAARRIPLVQVDSPFFQKSLHNAFLVVGAGLQKHVVHNKRIDNGQLTVGNADTSDDNALLPILNCQLDEISILINGSLLLSTA